MGEGGLREDRPTPGLTARDFETHCAADVEVLRPFATVEMHPAGATLFRQDHAPRAMFIVERGEVELAYQTPFDRLVVELLGPGSTLGALAALLEVPYPYTATARAETRLLRFSLETMQALVDRHPDICFRWLRLIALRLERAHRRLVELGGKSAVERAARYLVNEADGRGASQLRLTQADLAALIGVSRQTVSQALRALARQGLIEQGRGVVRIRDLDGLRARIPR
jgi:CRP-like cAMP-binding protein